MVSGSTADLLTVVSDRIASAFNRSGAITLVFDISKPFDRVSHAGLLHKPKACVSYFYQIFIFSVNYSPSKIMKIAYFIEKTLFVLEIF